MKKYRTTLVKVLAQSFLMTYALLSYESVTIAQSMPESCFNYDQAANSKHLASDYVKPSLPAKPDKNSYVLDNQLGSCIRRITDHTNEPPNGFARNHYSRRQAFNSDESLLLVYAVDGYWHLYDANTFKYVRKLSLGGADVEPQWSPDNPHLLYKFPQNGGLVVLSHHVLSDHVKVVADFRDVREIKGHPGITSILDIWPDTRRIWTKSEGSPSKDARYWGLQVETEDFKSIGAIAYDMLTNSIVGIFDFNKDGNGIGRPDHISMSPSGKYVVPSWYSQSCDNVSSGSTSKPCGLMVYTRDFSNGYSVAVRGEHSDIAIGANGHDVIVMPNYVSGYVEMYDIENRTTEKLWRIYRNSAATAMHVSGKSYNRPGWVLISTYATNGKPQWWTNRIMAVQLKKSPKIYLLANTFNKDGGYWTEPHAVVNHAFTKVLFNSNWGSGDNDIDVYTISVNKNLLD